LRDAGYTVMRCAPVRGYIFPSNGHWRRADLLGLHCVRSDANGGLADAGCGAEQDHALLR